MGMTTAYDTNERDDEESVRVIHRAVELGVTLVDTAEVYGPYENEELVGQALAEGNLRDRVVLATKTGLMREHGNIRPDGRPERIRDAIDGSLRRLDTDHVDLYYLHRVDPEVPIEESWGSMKEVVEAGKAVRLGISEATLEQIEKAHAIHPVSAVQSEMSLWTRDWIEAGVVNWCAEAAWGKKPFDVYAATETAGIASECDLHRGMHLFEDLVITEVVDEDNRPVPPGVYGEKVLVTVLFSRTLPLIRYEMSDSVRPATSPYCPCGRPFALIDGVQGRVEDVLHFPARSGDRVTVQPALFHRVMDAVPAGGWQLIQEPEGLTVLLSGVQKGYVDDVLADSLRRELAAQGVIVPSVEVRRVPAIPRTGAGKAPLIKASVT